MEFVDGGNLYDAMKKGDYFSCEKAAGVARDILRGLSHMHRRGFFHRDIKPENILVTKGLCKIADLGCAREVRSAPPYTDYVSTRWYRAPELLLGSASYGPGVDCWGLGCALAEMYLGAPLFPGTSDLDQLMKVVGYTGTPCAGGGAGAGGRPRALAASHISSLLFAPSKKRRRLCFLGVAITGCAFLASSSMLSSSVILPSTYGGRPFEPLRYVLWAHTTPAMALIVAAASSPPWYPGDPSGEGAAGTADAGRANP